MLFYNRTPSDPIFFFPKLVFWPLELVQSTIRKSLGPSFNLFSTNQVPIGPLIRPWRQKVKIKAFLGKMNMGIVFYVQFWVRNDLADRLCRNAATNFGIFFSAIFLVIFRYNLARANSKISEIWDTWLRTIIFLFWLK